jgi:plasmid maintenance system killer protein
MRWQHTLRSKADYDNASRNVQKAFDKQVRLLAANLLYPSLHAKKYDESQDLWQARVNQAWRFYFRIEEDTYIIVRIIPHPKD